MEKAGWIGREVHEADRRAHRVQITAAGRRKFTAARRIASALQREILSVLPASELAGFLTRLERVANSCQHAAEATKKS